MYLILKHFMKAFQILKPTFREGVFQILKPTFRDAFQIWKPTFREGVFRTLTPTFQILNLLSVGHFRLKN